MFLSLAIMVVILVVGNIFFRNFDPKLSWWCRLLKAFAGLTITALVSHYFGTIGVIVWFSLIAAPLVYVHAIWLPRNGVNGWTGEPRERYYALRGWQYPE